MHYNNKIAPDDECVDDQGHIVIRSFYHDIQEIG